MPNTRLKVALFCEFDDPNRLSSFMGADHVALQALGEVRATRSQTAVGWRRLLGPRGWLPSHNVMELMKWCDVGLQWFASTPGPAIAARLLGKPLVIVAGGYDVAYEPESRYGMMIDFRTRLMAQTALRLARRVLAVSNCTLQETKRWVPRANAELLYLGFDSELFNPGDESKPRSRSVVTVSRVGADWVRKGLETFVLAARELPEVPFRLLGPFDSRVAEERLRSLAPGNVEFLGGVPHERVRDVLREASVCVQLATHESFCCAIAEAMLCGCTPVVTRRGALPEVVGETGYYVEPNDPKAAAAAIKRALNTPAGDLPRRRIKELFPKAARQDRLRRIVFGLVEPARGDSVVRPALDPSKGSDAGKSRVECSRCILDATDDPDLDLDEACVCHYCREYDRLHARIGGSDASAQQALLELVASIKQAGVGKPYDCVLGVSGGLDSTYAALVAVRSGLRPLLVHLDNSWNTELAVANIERLVGTLKLDLFTHVIDWSEFRDLQLAFLRASVIDIEMITDHAIGATLYRTAAARGLRYIISGTNIATEAVLPPHWYHLKSDWLNIQSIHRLFGRVPLRTFPHISYWDRLYWGRVRRIKSVSILDFVEYDRAKAKREVSRELGWRDYGGKHHESFFTRFYQMYILPKKFGVDKRKAHLSTLICSGQITRAEALEELALTSSGEELERDKEYVLKKLGLSPAEFEQIMALPARRHTDYPSYVTREHLYEERLLDLTRPFRRRLAGRL